MAPLKEYLNKQYQTPQVLKNKYAGSRILIIGTGTSSKNLMPYKNKIRNKFDVIIGTNFSTRGFEEELDFRLIVEKKSTSFVQDLLNRNCRKNLTHIINWKAIDQYPNFIPRIKTTRQNFNFNPNVREYSWGGEEGLLIGPHDSKGLSVGSVSCCALHLACIMGAKEVYMVGCDLFFRDGGDHFYGGNYYSTSTTKPENRSPFVEIEKDGVKYKTLEFFRESARFVDKVIVDYCRPIGIEVFDFSDGLITKANKLKTDGFFK